MVFRMYGEGEKWEVSSETRRPRSESGLSHRVHVLPKHTTHTVDPPLSHGNYMARGVWSGAWWCGLWVLVVVVST